MTTKQSIRNAGRISYEQQMLARKQARLATLEPGSPAHVKCVNSIAKTEQLLADLGHVSQKLASRPAKEPKVSGGKRGPKGPVGPRTGTRFSIELGDDLVANDSAYPLSATA